jgi:hypothetical protein
MSEDSSAETPAAAASAAPSAKTVGKAKGLAGKRKAGKGKAAKSQAPRASAAADPGSKAKYPRHSLTAVLRIPRGILDQNAGKECSDEDAGRFAGVGLSGEFRLELSSATKYGLIERPSPRMVKVTDVARKILRPQNQSEELEGLRQAALAAPDIADVYKHYRGENLPDTQFFDNALIDTFRIPSEKLSEFKKVFFETLKAAQLVTELQGKFRIIDVSQGSGPLADSAKIQQPTKGVAIAPGETCFVMMPFAAPVGGYYSTVYEPAIRKAGLTPVRADAEIFGTGKIMDQIWRGLNSAKVLVAELTGRNPNVFYELGLAHALDKPVVLVSSNEDDVPFDLQQIRVIYYDMKDPFWGQKLIDKIAENVASAIKNPEEATFKKIS